MRMILSVTLCLSSGAVAFAGDTAKKPDAAKPATLKLFIDIHRGMPKNMTEAQLADGHLKDAEAEKKVPGVHYTAGWYDKEKGVLMCQCEAARKEDCEKVHVLAHGKAADEIFEVQSLGPPKK